MKRVIKGWEMRLAACSVMAVVMGMLACAPGVARANDLLDAYEAAQIQDATLQAAFYDRAAQVEARPQAVAAFLPQLDATASVARAREAYETQPAGNGATTGATAGSVLQGFYGSTHGVGLTLNQTLWSFESFHLLQEADLQVAQAEATYRSAQQNLILRVAQAYFGILAAADTQDVNHRERGAFEGTAASGPGPRTDWRRAAQRRGRSAIVL